VFIGGQVGTAGSTSLIRADGSAKFAGDVRTSNGLIQAVQLMKAGALPPGNTSPSSVGMLAVTTTNFDGNNENMSFCGGFNGDNGNFNLTSYISAANGSAQFAGTVTANGSVLTRNVELSLDTGETLDVKERLQNTQAVLLRIKAALIQPDADANTLRARLLEALDILVDDDD
jgi:hypothetical protein